MIKTRTYARPVTLLENFCVGMDREVKEFKPMEEGTKLNLGAGYKDIKDTEPLDLSNGWLAPTLDISDESICGVYAYHFLEHLNKNDLLDMLHEVERVLIPGGLFNIVVPYWSSELAYQDLDHKTFWTEKTFPNLFFNKYYDGSMDREWHFQINSQVIMGINHRNLCLLVQLEKMPMPDDPNKAPF